MKEIDSQTKEKRNKEYNTKARNYPAYLSLAVPIVLGITMGIADQVDKNLWIKAISYVLSITAICTALLFLLKFTLRDISKVYPGMILFCDRLKPTTRLLYSDVTDFTEDHKKAIRKKIKTHHGIDLQAFKKKNYKNKTYVKRVDEAVKWLLDVTRFDDILFEYNCVYGFWRNLTAAIFVDAILVFVLAGINRWSYPLPCGDSFLGIGLFLVFASIVTTLITYFNGRTFARRVYDVFMNLNDDKNNY